MTAEALEDYLPGMPADDAAAAEEDERELSGEDDAPAAPAPARNARRRAPGPAPDPNSGRQRKLRRAAERSKTAPGPARKRTPNKAATPPPPADAHLRGAYAVIGWIAKPLAIGAIVTAGASQLPKVPEARRMAMAQQAEALSLDSATVQYFAPALAEGLAELAPNLPWMARVLEGAAKISPYQALAEGLATLTLQIMVNHGLMPPRPELGTMEPIELLRAVGAIPQE